MDEEEEFVERATNHELLFSYTEDACATKLLKRIMKCILCECIDQLFILRCITGSSIVHSDDPPSYVSLDERYTGTEDHAETRISSVTSNYDKLAKDIHLIIVVLSDTKSEINMVDTFKVLQESCVALARMQEDEVQLMLDASANEKAVVELTNLLEEERLANIRTIEETQAKIQKLRFEVEDVVVYGRYEKTYFERWELSRNEQNRMICNDKENSYKNTIKQMEDNIELENRCHMELMSYVAESKNDYMEEIQYWMKRYDDELDSRENDLITIKANLEKITEDLEKTRNLYAERTAAIADWLEYKRIKKEKEDREALEIWAATKIQAWWRGVMFRKKLGPYRKKKGKGKGKDKKKGKGKK
ncbi:unnamed protein product [Callosobruchus maculatus]|uniref:Dynein regulatory complex protein 9 n=1 Tax=Callosobruchus maculatus TaxID=64391 RepID=A0A653CJ09_CALMS|nr:unnamed protein product [Callosobruchus maculatus]